MSWVVSPSRSRSSPAPRLSSEMVRGCTNSSVTSVQRSVRRTRPSGSPCTVRRRADRDDAAPLGRHDEQLLVGLARPQRRQGEAGSRDARRAARPAAAACPRLDSLVTEIRPVAGSPTVTRSGSTSVSMRTRVRPTASSRSTARAGPCAAAPIMTHSSQSPAPRPRPSRPRPSARTLQPSGETQRRNAATGAHTGAVGSRSPRCARRARRRRGRPRRPRRQRRPGHRDRGQRGSRRGRVALAPAHRRPGIRRWRRGRRDAGAGTAGPPRPFLRSARGSCARVGCGCCAGSFAVMLRRLARPAGRPRRGSG